jgi:hypothetical protein
MVSYLGILGARSVVPSLRDPCVQSNVEAMFHLLTVAFVWALVVESSCKNMKLSATAVHVGKSFIHLGFVFAEI